MDNDEQSLSTSCQSESEKSDGRQGGRGGAKKEEVNMLLGVVGMFVGNKIVCSVPLIF